ncbi:hypothetical protein ElyMa_005425900 [Elysia marginata]|uniref:Uncharacterized protein n=1 Tax=Elysia marginata TaxID=1093978 RepID=A0AAV4EKY2_9GAST|nr:hypothetical protein ElyMa_005425900 [Elysia marginata]
MLELKAGHMTKMASHVNTEPRCKRERCAAWLGDKGMRINIMAGGCFNFNVPVKYMYEVISEEALGTIESVLPYRDVRGACVHHTQLHYPDIGPTKLNTKSTMPNTRRHSPFWQAEENRLFRPLPNFQLVNAIS